MTHHALYRNVLIIHKDDPVMQGIRILDAHVDRLTYIAILRLILSACRPSDPEPVKRLKREMEVAISEEDYVTAGELVFLSGHKTCCNYPNPTALAIIVI